MTLVFSCFGVERQVDWRSPRVLLLGKPDPYRKDIIQQESLGTDMS